MRRLLAIFLISMLLVSCFEGYALARAGGGRSSGFSYGSRGSRTYAPPARPVPAPWPTQAQKQNTPPQQPTAAPVPQPAPGGFTRALFGGLIGGVIGSLLFSSLGYAGAGRGLFGGIGIFEIMLIGAGLFLLYRFMAGRRQAADTYYGSQGMGDYSGSPETYAPGSSEPLREGSPGAALYEIRQFDPGFDEAAFKENAEDIFFKVQAAWMRRDFDSMKESLAPEIGELMRQDISRMKSEGRINRLENIAMRDISIAEAWVEEGREFITVKILANVLDYTTDGSGNLIEGNRTEPVKFIEYWTFVKPVGRGGWQLSAIQQDS